MPDLPGRLHYRIQLLPHLVFAENFRIDAAEAALGAQCELLYWEEFARLIDSSLQLIYGLHVGILGRNQAEDSDFISRHETQRLEAAGAVAVVLEQDALMFECVE